MKKIRLFMLFSIVFLMLAIPATFAFENETAMESSYSAQDVLSADYYFDANAADDSGDGSQANPYKDLTAVRVKENSNIHLASGEYTLNAYKSIYNVTFIGSGASNTTISYHGSGFGVYTTMSLNNVTLNNLIVTVNGGTLNAENVVFRGGMSSSDGGAINSATSSDVINLKKCTFMDSYANHGGAISVKGGTLNIENCLFTDTYSKLYGGAIAAKSKSKISINNTRFSNTYAEDDAGGAIYIHDSTLNGLNIEIVNSTANFGGAITSLKSYVYLTNLTATLNSAKYDGGAIYAMYREFSILNSLFNGNAADNGGAIYAWGIESFIIMSNTFSNNNALDTAGGVYSLKNYIYYDSILDKALNNTFINNKPADVYESDSISFIIENVNDQQIIRYNASYNGTLPDSYDLRTLGYVTPVKNQANDGNCWAFATLSVLESNILKATGIELDLSEENMKDLMAEFSIYGFQIETNIGGYHYMGYEYLVSWLGPVNESDDKYKVGTVLSPILGSVINVQNILFISRSNYTDNDAVKKAIMDYGAVHTSMYHNSKYFKGNDYYDNNTADINSKNHAVAIVGWDDNRVIAGAPANGAWIAKNSWGPNWKENGYFYVSYYDVCFAKDMWTFVLNDTVKYDKNYQYDLSGKTDFYFNESSTVWYKNRYTATDNERLMAVSTYFEKQTSWNLYVYVNGKLKLTQSGVDSSCYKTIDLYQPVTLKTGDVFEIVFKIAVDGDAGVPISEAYSFNQNYLKENMSFISYNGKKWEDLLYKSGTYPGHTYHGNQAACIKAFTIINSDVVLDVDYSSFELTVTLMNNETGQPIKGANVVVSINGEDYNVKINSKGEGKLSLADFELGTYTVTAAYKGSSIYNPATVTKSIIVKYEAELSAVYDSASKELVVSLVNATSGSPLKGANVVVNINGEKYNVKINSKGEGRLSLADLAIGTYRTTLSYKGNANYAPVSIAMNVLVRDAVSLSAHYDSASKELVVSLTDALSGSPLKGATVVVNINGINYNVKINSKGEGRLSLADLDYGTYAVTLTYKGNAQYAFTTVDLNVEVKDAVDLSAVYDELTKELTVGLFDDSTGSPLKGANVVVNVLGTNHNVRISSAGYGVYSLADLAPGSYTISVTYKGNAKYASSNKSLIITV